jgi:hypothetical protein
MDFVEALQGYFRGERHVALFVIGVGVAWLGFAAWVWRTQQGGFAWGLLVPFALIGAGALFGGASLVLKTDKQVAALVELDKRDRPELVRQELPRMEKVNANWPRLKLTWAVVCLAALALIFFIKKDWAAGLGLALLLNAAAAMSVDVFAERRAVTYADALKALPPPAP